MLTKSKCNLISALNLTPKSVMLFVEQKSKPTFYAILAGVISLLLPRSIIIQTLIRIIRKFNAYRTI
jgi:hypothetical protein